MTQAWTISRWLTVIFAIAVVCSGLAVGFLLHSREESSVRAIAESRAEATARYVFEHVYSAMQRGTQHDEIAGIITRLNQTTDASEIDLIQGPTVAAQYGAAPDAEALRISDPLVARVFAERIPVSDAMDEKTLRFLYPLMLAEECRACHQGTTGQTVNGVIDLRFPVEPLRAPLAFITDAAVLGFLGALLVIFVAVFLMVRLVVVRPVHALADAMARLSATDTAEERISAPHPRAREVEVLTSAFNTLMERITRHRRSLERQALDLTAAKEAAESAHVEADAANRAKSEFLASMSHELRTPLNAVLGFSEIIRDETLGPVGQCRYREYARDIHDSGSLLRDLVDDLLDLARIEAGRLELSPEPLDIASEIRTSVRLLQGRAEEADLRLTWQVAPNMPPLVADLRALRQVLVNLVSNAIKYTPSGGAVHVSAYATEAHIVITVADTGIGIDKAFHELVFSAYGRVVNVETRNIEGTGLGLALVKALTEQQGGTVTLVSAPGDGATFTLRFPRNDTPDQDTETQPDQARADAAGLPEGEPEAPR